MSERSAITSLMEAIRADMRDDAHLSPEQRAAGVFRMSEEDALVLIEELRASVGPGPIDVDHALALLLWGVRIGKKISRIDDL